jgi:hypothetical protein
MSARIPPNFAEVWTQFNVTGDNENMYVALGVDLAVGVAANQTDTDVLLAAALGALRPMVSSDYTLGPGHVIWGQDGGDIRIDGTASPAAGTSSAGGAAPNCAVLVRKLTAAGGRRGRGRMYVPGPPDGSVNPNGDLSTAYKTTCTTQVNALLSNMVALVQVDACVLFHDTSPFTPTTITSLEVQNKIATQRRRLRP